MNLPRSRPLLVGASLVPVVLLAALLYVRSVPPRIGDFTMPKLDGWQQSVFKTARYQRVVYTKKSPDHISSISMVWQSYRASNPPKTVQDLQNEVARAIRARPSRTTSDGTRYEVGLPHLIPFNGMPAVESARTISQNTQPGLSRSKSINFVNGPNFYILHASVSTGSSSVTPAMQTELDEAFEEVVEALQPSSSGK